MSDQTPAQDTAADPAAEPSSDTEPKASPDTEPDPSPGTGTDTAPGADPTPAPGTATHTAPEQPSPHPLGVTVERTGNADVDALLERLADADDLPTDGHIEVYEDVHRGLRDTLTALDSRPGPPGPNRRHDDRS